MRFSYIKRLFIACAIAVLFQSNLAQAEPDSSDSSKSYVATRVLIRDGSCPLGGDAPIGLSVDPGTTIGLKIAERVVDVGVDALAELLKKKAAGGNKSVLGFGNTYLFKRSGQSGDGSFIRQCVILVQGEIASQPGNVPNDDNTSEPTFKGWAKGKKALGWNSLGVKLVSSPKVYLEAFLLPSEDGSAVSFAPAYLRYDEPLDDRGAEEKKIELTFSVLVPASGNALTSTQIDSQTTSAGTTLVIDEIRPPVLIESDGFGSGPKRIQTPWLVVTSDKGQGEANNCEEGTGCKRVPAVVTVKVHETSEASWFWKFWSDVFNDDTQKSIGSELKSLLPQPEVKKDPAARTAELQKEIERQKTMRTALATVRRLNQELQALRKELQETTDEARKEELNAKIGDKEDELKIAECQASGICG